MTYKVFVINDRVKYLSQQLGDRVIVINEEDNMTVVEVTINDSMDVLSLFHAGVMAGLNEYN